MQLNFIGHGLDPTNENTVGNILATSFQETTSSNDLKFDRFYGFVAFASISGVRRLLPFINEVKQSYKELTFFIGVDENATSKEALQQLIVSDVETYIFHTQSAMIYHPKVFLFEGKNWTRLIIGSTNLTHSGLFVNVEAAISMDFRPTDPQGNKIVNQLKSYFGLLIDKTDKNLERLTAQLLETLCKQGLVVDEIRTRTKTPEQIAELDELNLFPDRDKLEVNEMDLGNADLPDEIRVDKNYDLQFTANDIENFPYFFERWLQYKNDNPRSGGIVSRETDERPLHTWFRKLKYLLGKQKEIP